MASCYPELSCISSIDSSSSRYLYWCLKHSSGVSHASWRPNDHFYYGGCTYTVGLDCSPLCSGILSLTSHCHSQMIHTACVFTDYRIPSRAKLGLQPNEIQEQFGDCVSPGTVPAGRMDRQILLSQPNLAPAQHMPSYQVFLCRMIFVNDSLSITLK